MRCYFFVIFINLLLMDCLAVENIGLNDRMSSGQPNDLNAKLYPGGLSEQNPNDPIYKEMAEESLKIYLQDIRSNQHHQLLQVTKVTTQVVAGTATRINFNAAPTNCRLVSDMKPSNPPCAVTDLSKTITCYSEIWEQSWIPKKHVKVICSRSI